MTEILHEILNIEIMIWLFPITFMFHNLEEIITIEGFIAKYHNLKPKTSLAKTTLIIKEKLGGRSPQFAVAIVWMLLIISFIVLRASHFIPDGGNFLLFTGVFNVFFLQAFSHISQTVILRDYTPGVLTALFIVIPYCLFTYYHLFEWGLIDRHLIIESLPISLIMIPVFLIGNLLGRQFVR